MNHTALWPKRRPLEPKGMHTEQIKKFIFVCTLQCVVHTVLTATCSLQVGGRCAFRLVELKSKIQTIRSALLFNGESSLISPKNRPAYNVQANCCLSGVRCAGRTIPQACLRFAMRSPSIQFK